MVKQPEMAGAEAPAAPDTAPADQPPAEKTPQEQVKATGERYFFEGTVAKIDKDGNEVLSDHLDPGETLRADLTEAYTPQKKADTPTTG
jgi:hypothetical protein